MSDAISLECDSGVLTLTLNRPDKKNAITADMYAHLAAALRDAESDKSIRAVLFQGAGGDFTAGNDLADFLNNPPTDESAPVFQFLKSLASATLPYVAAVDGVAIGIGSTLLLHCDAVLVTKRARLQMPFVDLALVPEAASSLLLPQRMGHLRAAELLMLGEAIDGQHAVDLGLANRLVGSDELLASAQAIARRFAQKPPGALRATKQLMRGGLQIGDVMESEAALFVRQLKSPEARDAFSAFLAKRPKDSGSAGA